MIDNSIQAKYKANEVNAKLCKALILMIEEEAEKGNYELTIGKEMVSLNKTKYLKYLGFNVYDTQNNMGKVTIKW